MKQNKGDGPKIAVLIAGIVLAVGFFAKTLFGAVGSKPAPAPAQPSPQPLASANPPVASNSLLHMPSSKDAGPMAPMLSTNPKPLVNPFRKTVVEQSEARQPEPIHGQPAPIQPIKSSPMPGPVLPAAQDRGFQPMNVSIAEVLPKLEGVVLGKEPLAVTSSGSETKFLHVGDRVAPGLYIAGIAKTAVRVRGKKASSLWRVGDPLPSMVLR